MPDTNIPVTDDAELLASCAAFHSATAEVERINNLSGVYDDLYGVKDDPCEKPLDRWYDALEEVTMLRPSTPAGRLEKLRVAREAMKSSLNPKTMDREVFIAMIVLDELMMDADCTGDLSKLGPQPLSSSASGSSTRGRGRGRHTAQPD